MPQSRVWMVHVAAVLHCASGDDWGSRKMYPDSCGPPNKFHTNSTDASRTPVLPNLLCCSVCSVLPWVVQCLHTLQHNKSGGLASLCVSPFSPTNRHVIKMIRDMRNEKRDTKIKYSFFGLFCTINQLIRFNSNHWCV